MIADERALWLQHVPEMAPIFKHMPERDGQLDVVYGFAKGGVAVMVTLRDAGEGPPEWWWHESVYVPTTETGKLVTRLLMANLAVSRLTGAEGPQMGRSYGEHKDKTSRRLFPEE
jgi:hypothetical protein